MQKPERVQTLGPMNGKDLLYTFRITTEFLAYFLQIKMKMSDCQFCFV